MPINSLRFVSLILLITILSFSTTTRRQTPGSRIAFRAALPEQVSDIERPLANIAYGTVVLDVRISANGEVQDIEVRRHIGGLSEAVIAAVRAWRFQPAQSNGHRVGSRVTVAVSFSIGPQGDPPLPPLIRQNDESRIQSAFQSAEVTRAKVPGFPIRALGPGTVTLGVSVDPTGKPQRTTVLREDPPFLPVCLEAAQGWRFIPAMLNGVPVRSEVILAFVFTQPVNPPWSS